MAGQQQTRLEDDRYVALIAADSARFVEVLTPVAAQARVPPCPEWTANDLAFHLCVVQRFWAGVVAGPLLDVEAAGSQPSPDRPASHDALLAATAAASAALIEALQASESAAPAWSWSAEQRAGFTFRRQAHEACIHRVDAELTAAPDGSARSPIDAMLATDGVDEALRIMHAERPDWAAFTPDDGRMLRLVATDTAATWLVSVGRLTGTDPDTGDEVDEVAIAVADADPADGTVRPRAILTGAAEDLYCHLWARPTVGDLHRNGDLVLVAEFEAFLSSGTL